MNILNSLIKSFLDKLLPINCLNCQKEGIWLCKECKLLLEFEEKQTCPACDTISRAGQTCLNCQSNYPLAGLFSAGKYQQSLLREMIKKLKFQGIKELGPILADFLYCALEQQIAIWPEFLSHILTSQQKTNPLQKFLSFSPLIIPIPLSEKRKRWRGYNQSEIIAESLAEKLNLLVDAENFKKIRHSKAQADLNLEKRLNNLDNCFTWTKNNLRDQKIILLDDVSTSGATLKEAAKTLKKFSAGDIWGLVVAKG